MSSTEVFDWVILPLLIFVARIFDVSLGTIRIIFVSRGRRNLAPVLGFFEVLIWIVVIGQLVQHLHSITSYIGYAAGFAAGNYLGMMIEQRLAVGYVVVRVIVQNCGAELMHALHEAGYGVTGVDAEGSTGPVKLVYTIVRRKHLPEVNQIIHQTCPNAFVTVEDVRSAQEGIFPRRTTEVREQFKRVDK